MSPTLKSTEEWVTFEAKFGEEVVDREERDGAVVMDAN